MEKGEFCYNKSYSNGYPWGATKRLNDFEKAVVTTLYICFGIKDNIIKTKSMEFALMLVSIIKTSKGNK
ncbi:MAG: hypothetical protein FJY07_10695 [Bacteroidetes bacterium]|nr:hypothetical protein [Bacteroidota bacterium]